MIPDNAKFVLRFNPKTGTCSNVGNYLGGRGGDKFSGAVLASNGYIYATPQNAKQVLKIKSWDNWLYLKHRLLVEQERAIRTIQSDDELNIVQYFIIYSIDDIFRTILGML